MDLRAAASGGQDATGRGRPFGMHAPRTTTFIRPFNGDPRRIKGSGKLAAPTGHGMPLRQRKRNKVNRTRMKRNSEDLPLLYENILLEHCRQYMDVTSKHDTLIFCCQQ